jgi:hypothetical protein
MTLRNELERRWKSSYESHSAASNAQRYFESALRILDETSAARAKIDADKNLSDLGKKQALRDAASKFGWLGMRTRDGAAEFKKAVQAQRDALAPKPKDKTDVAAAMVRVQMRTFLQSKTQAEIAALAMSDENFAEAIFEAPAALSGLTSEARDHLLRSHLERTAGPALAAIDEQAEAVELIETAVGAASNALATAVGVSPDRLDEWLSTQTAPTGIRIDLSKYQ